MGPAPALFTELHDAALLQAQLDQAQVWLPHALCLDGLGIELASSGPCPESGELEAACVAYGQVQRDFAFFGCAPNSRGHLQSDLSSHTEKARAS